LSEEHTRRSFLKVAGAGAAWVALSGALGCEPEERSSKTPPKTPQANTEPQAQLDAVRVRPSGRPEEAWTFRSRPNLRPPVLRIDTPARGTAPGYVFVAPKRGEGQFGTLIFDNDGEPVWVRPLENQELYPMDFKVQLYGGEPVLTWCESKVLGGHGFGEYVIADTSYREITRVQAGNGYQADHHEFLITPRNTALITAFGKVQADLTSMGGTEDQLVWDSVAQEVDIETGEVLFEWHSIDHIAVDETFVELSSDMRVGAFCYFHINSVDIDSDGDLLISARNTFAVYKVDRETGEVIWRLGGKKSDFDMGPGTWIRYQHDARRQPDGTITIFDNGGVRLDGQSFGITLDLDMDNMKATLVSRYDHPDKPWADTQGNVQMLPNGNAFVGWGDAPSFAVSEFDADGELLFSASLPNTLHAYRAFRFPWTGSPGDAPAVAAERESDEEITVYASWNGATDVAEWQVLTGDDPERLQPSGVVARDGFETAIAVPTAKPYVGVRALGDSGKVLGTSETVEA
jgi:hypothetical protein